MTIRIVTAEVEIAVEAESDLQAYSKTMDVLRSGQCYAEIEDAEMVAREIRDLADLPADLIGTLPWGGKGDKRTCEVVVRETMEAQAPAPSSDQAEVKP